MRMGDTSIHLQAYTMHKGDNLKCTALHITPTLGWAPKVNPDIRNFFLNLSVLNGVANPKNENLKNENLR